MGWTLVVILNGVIATCYVLIAGLIAQGLVRTRQVRTNPLALATAGIFLTCAVHHAHHGLHLVAGGTPAELATVRAMFGEWHSVAIDVLGAVVALTYLGLRRSYRALLNTPAMFDDAVRLAAEQHWRERALTDQLTGIPNRAAYQHLADDLLDDVDTGDVAVLFIDLDGFKQINDEFGHDAGDRLLHDVAQRLHAGRWEGEDVFRLGGDEFVIVCAERSSSLRLPDVVQRVHRQISAPFEVRSGQIVIGASIGAAAGPASRGVDRLLRQADASMYQIKGRSLRSVPRPRAQAVLSSAAVVPAAGPDVTITRVEGATVTALHRT